jgi:hypothetical protein
MGGEDACASDLAGAVSVDVSDCDFVEVADGDDDDLEYADVDAASGDVAALSDPADLFDVVGDESAQVPVVCCVDELLGEGDGVVADGAAGLGGAERLGDGSAGCVVRRVVGWLGAGDGDRGRLGASAGDELVQFGFEVRVARNFLVAVVGSSRSFAVPNGAASPNSPSSSPASRFRSPERAIAAVTAIAPARGSTPVAVTALRIAAA